jgi:hypothetical protein
MDYKDLSFDIINKDGMEVTCDIKAVIPNPDNQEEPFVIFTDYTLDENDDFVNLYGQIIEENGQSALKQIIDKETINKIIELSKDEVVQYVNDQIQDNII